MIKVNILGDTFKEVFEKAMEIARKKEGIVQYKFNDIKIEVTRFSEYSEVDKMYAKKWYELEKKEEKRDKKRYEKKIGKILDAFGPFHWAWIEEDIGDAEYYEARRKAIKKIRKIA